MKTYSFKKYQPKTQIENRQFLSENRDCTVRALSLMLGSYERAHKILKNAGRKDKKGFPLSLWLKHLEVLEGMKIEEVGIPWNGKGKYKMTPARFCQEYSHGSYIVMIASHAFAVINGTIIDSSQTLVRPGTRIYSAFKFTECPWEPNTLTPSVSSLNALEI